MATTGAKSGSALKVETGQPVKGFPLKFSWYAGDWKRIFDAQTALVKEDVGRARAEGRQCIYLSCPISSRGGGWSGTNVDIARHVERSLLDRWGEAFWVLNPAQYQLESRAGTGLIVRHAKQLGIDLDALMKKGEPGGGDYLRMWTKVLVEDAVDNLGRNFDAFYFLGPRDVFSFFAQGDGTTLTAGIESYFAQKYATDPTFREGFTVPGITWGAPAEIEADPAPRLEWIRRRKNFVRFYGLRASANFSLGCHDEWNILRLVNAGRRELTAGPGKLDGDVGEQIAAFFDGNQVDPASSEAVVSRGYAV